MTEPAIAIEDARLKRLYEYWLSKKGDRKAPRRADILPEEITDILPWVFLIERVGHRLRYRLVGDEFRTIYGTKLTGMFMDEVDLDHVTTAYIGEYGRAEQEGPVVRKWKFTKLDGRHLEYERLILPLSSDGTIIDMFLGGADGVGYG
jgi:hypothetical protein